MCGDSRGSWRPEPDASAPRPIETNRYPLGGSDAANLAARCTHVFGSLSDFRLRNRAKIIFHRFEVVLPPARLMSGLVIWHIAMDKCDLCSPVDALKSDIDL